MDWLRGAGQGYLQQRKVAHKALEVEPDPYIVFTSNMSGLVASSRVLGESQPHMVSLLEEEFARWRSQEADEALRWHIHVWCLFRNIIQPDFFQMAKMKYPLPRGSFFWQQSEGTLWEKSTGRVSEHLWSWDGEKAHLLERDFKP